MKSLLKQLFFSTAAVAILFGLSACETTSLGRKNSFDFDLPHQAEESFQGEALPEHRAQRLYVVEGDKVLLATPVTVGAPSSPTRSAPTRFTPRLKTAAVPAIRMRVIR